MRCLVFLFMFCVQFCTCWRPVFVSDFSYLGKGNWAYCISCYGFFMGKSNLTHLILRYSELRIAFGMNFIFLAHAADPLTSKIIFVCLCFCYFFMNRQCNVCSSVISHTAYNPSHLIIIIPHQGCILCP